MQERARVEAETDDAWQGDDHELDILSGSSNTPDSVFVDTDIGADQMLIGNAKLSYVETNQLDNSIASEAVLLDSSEMSTFMNTPGPMDVDTKRGRGRPRKQKDLMGLGMCCFLIFLTRLI